MSALCNAGLGRRARRASMADSPRGHGRTHCTATRYARPLGRPQTGAVSRADVFRRGECKRRFTVLQVILPTHVCPQCGIRSDRSAMGGPKNLM
eukprot:9038786-Alexandrium_andersonii.AAC.1